MSRRAAEISCRELVELVTGYIEGHLDPEERARFEAHLDECSGCRTYLEQMRVTIRAFGRLPEESLAPEIREALLVAFREWRQ